MSGGLLDRWQALRDRLLASPGFQRRAAAFPTPPHQDGASADALAEGVGLAVAARQHEVGRTVADADAHADTSSIRFSILASASSLRSSAAAAAAATATLLLPRAEYDPCGAEELWAGATSVCGASVRVRASDTDFTPATPLPP